jgi:hypothetical protein
MIIALILTFGIGYLISRIRKEKKYQYDDGWNGQMGGVNHYGYRSGKKAFGERMGH